MVVAVAGSAVAVVLGCGVVVIGVDKLTVVLGGGWWQWLVGGDICDGVGWQQDVAVAECTVAGEGDGWVVMGWLLMEGGEDRSHKDFRELTYPSTEMGLCEIPVNPVEDVKCTIDKRISKAAHPKNEVYQKGAKEKRKENTQERKHIGRSSYPHLHFVAAKLAVAE
ncbi:hypothetical protein E3N88_33332 [Mikania micrantha]|uniref:Uncharacterized protein n=1 Tax=Mikania micrantha TaxID=192012 RepID=A0A5N6MCC0_9ASTR|nr:hypothetical protein E3N88_33332 [Mikania micrantha]